jgi:hypothetical protein
MNDMKLRRRTLVGALAMAGVLAILPACKTMSDSQYTQEVELTGANEVPPVKTAATGTATVTIKPDRSVSVKVKIRDIVATASHIHEAAAGSNGPVIVPFTKTADDTFESSPGAMLTESQYAAYKAGNLYVNVHSAKHPGGELRGQLKPY